MLSTRDKNSWTAILMLGSCILIGEGLKRVLPMEKEQIAANAVTTTVEKRDSIPEDSIRAWGLQEKAYFEGKQLIDNANKK